MTQQSELAYVLACLQPLMDAKGVTASPEAFHRAVNVAFHDAEAPAYDSVHAGMWSTLPQQFELLAGDVLAGAPHLRRPIRVADVGCGTGRSAEALLATSLGRLAGHVSLVDTSAAMLDQARARAGRWGVPVTFVEGGVEQLEQDRYDVVLVCSVLHHIPDLHGFLGRIAAAQTDGGVFMHLHDPNAHALASSTYAERAARFRAASEQANAAPRRRAAHLARRVARRLMGPTVDDTYVNAANATLLRAGVIRAPMTASEMWSVTDIHVEDLPYSTGGGVSLDVIRSALPNHDLLSFRSYGFFGVMGGELPTGAMQAEEQQLIDERGGDGRQLAGAWCKRTSAA